MNYLERIDAIERAAGDLGISLTKLCHLAKVRHTTVWRWKTGGVSPTLRKYDAVMAELERALDVEISRVRGSLASVERRRVA